MRKPFLAVLSPLLDKLHQLLWWTFILLAAGGGYLAAITFSEWVTNAILQGVFYQWMFASHLLIGLMISPIILYFIVDHFRRGWPRPNRKVVNLGLAVALLAFVIWISGILLIRFENFPQLKGLSRNITYWLHILFPIGLVLLYRLHRKWGKPMKVSHWHYLFKTFTVIVLLIVGVHYLQSVYDEPHYIQPYEPSLVAVPENSIIQSKDLLIDDYCEGCHQDVSKRWEHSAHHLSSLNNPVYAMSVNNTKKALVTNNSDPKAAQFCAGCHDPVLLLTGQFDSDKFKKGTPEAKAGVNCIACHSIQSIDGHKGNSSYQFNLPQHYPFAFSENETLRWISKQLLRAKPEHHKRSFLKPVHQSTAFCGSCHKVHIPESLNQYRWLRGQNHYDEFSLSGVSGQGVTSFYYPKKNHTNCNLCHMKGIDSKDPAARTIENSPNNQIHDHLFPSGNTQLQLFTDMPDKLLQERLDALKKVVRLDIIGFRQNGVVDGEFIGPEIANIKALTPGQDYLLEVVIRTTGLGHMLTGGTVDSNELWLNTQVHYQDEQGEHLLAESGRIDPMTGKVDENSHFVNAYLLDRHGNRIERRNVEDIFVPLYNHQIPPGAADVAHYKLHLPDSKITQLTIESSLNYRKFSNELLKASGIELKPEQIPVAVMAKDKLVLKENGSDKLEVIPLWQRWNDYGIALLRKPKKMQLKQAEHAFGQVQNLHQVDGAVNLVRVYLAEGRIADALTQLNKAIDMKTAHPWTLLWLKGQIEQKNGQLQQAVNTFKQIIETDFSHDELHLDFSKDYRLLNLLAQTEIEAALQTRRKNPEQSQAYLEQAHKHLQQVLSLDDEDAMAYFNLSRIAKTQGDDVKYQQYNQLHNKYRKDDFARSQAISLHREKNEAANNAANAVVIYPLTSEE